MKSPRGRSPNATRVAIIGGGRGGRALMEIFTQDPLAKIVGIAEIKSRAPGIKLAEQCGIPITKDYQELLKMKKVDLVIDVTGNPSVWKALQKNRRSHLAIIGGASAKFMWQLIDARIRATIEIEKNLTRYQLLFRRYVKEEAESAVDEERKRLACEIHDGLVQTLVGVNFKMERCRELLEYEQDKCSALMHEAKAQLKHGIGEARQVVFNLRPGQYEKLALVSALSNYFKAYEKDTRIQVEFTHIGSDSFLHPKTKVFLFRIVQEALHNTSKHANASKISVQLTIKADMLTARIQDDGVGFDVKAVYRDPEKWDHFGLRGIKERAKLLGGEARWESKKGNGTTVTIIIPLIRKFNIKNVKKN